MSLVRVLKSAAVAMTHTFYVDEQATDASTGVTVAVTRLDGTAVASGAATHPGLGQYAYTVPGQSTLDTLVVTWTATSIGGAVVTAADYIEIAGGYLFGLTEARALDPPLNSVTYPTATLAARRIEVEQECERICRQAFVPRFYRETLNGTGTDRLGLKWMMLRRLRAVTVSGVAWTSPDVTAVPPADNGIARRPAGAIWPEGVGNIVVEYEHGWDYPPEEIRTAAMKRLRSRLTPTSSGVPDRAVSWSAQDGGTYRISLPGKQTTGVADVDGVYERYTRLPRAVFA
jgi:hypothetical protein